MNNIGERIVRDRALADEKIKRAKELESEARKLWAEAHEIERLLENARTAEMLGR